MITRYLNRHCTAQNVTCKRTSTDVPVENGLAMTPAQMNDMMLRGLPIASANLGLQYEEGVSKLDFEPAPEHKRGVDMNDLFEQRAVIRKRFAANLKAYKTAQAEKGE